MSAVSPFPIPVACQAGFDQPGRHRPAYLPEGGGHRHAAFRNLAIGALKTLGATDIARTTRAIRDNANELSSSWASPPGSIQRNLITLSGQRDTSAGFPNACATRRTWAAVGSAARTQPKLTARHLTRYCVTLLPGSQFWVGWLSPWPLAAGL